MLLRVDLDVLAGSLSMPTDTRNTQAGPETSPLPNVGTAVPHRKMTRMYQGDYSDVKISGTRGRAG